MNTKIFLVDDHPMLCSGLCQEIGKRPGLQCVGQAAQGAGAVEQIRELSPDLVILDLHLPDMSGIEVTRAIRSVLREVRIIIFSAETARSEVDKALQAGAGAYVLKTGSVEELFTAIAMVLNGRVYMSPEISADILQDYRETLINNPNSGRRLLSAREEDLLRLVAAGESNKQIAVRLNVSLSSVETYRYRLKKKLGCQSTADLVRYALSQKIALL